MDKNGGPKKKLTGPATSPMTSFFASTGTRQDAAAEACAVDKMVGVTGTVGGEIAKPITHSEWRAELAGGFERMEKTLLEKISTLITSFTAQIQDIKQAVDQVAQMADAAMENLVFPIRKHPAAAFSAGVDG